MWFLPHKFLIFLVILKYASCSDISLSLSGFDDLLAKEKTLMEIVNVFGTTSEKLDESLERTLKEITDEHKKSQIDGNYLNHPLNSFSLLFRSVFTWEKIMDILIPKVDSFSENYKNIFNEILQNKVNYSEVSDISLTLAKMQDMYQLDIKKLTSGIINGKIGKPLSPEICFKIGESLFHSQMYNFSIKWTSEAVEICEKDENCSDLFLVEAYKLIANTEIKLRNFDDAIETVEILKEKTKNPETIYKIYKEISLESKKDKIESILTYADTYEYEFHHKVCRDEFQPHPTTQRSLSCKWKFGPNHFLRLAPLKMEELSKSPYVAVFHNVISDEEIEVVKNIAKPIISPSLTFAKIADKSRFSKSTFLDYRWHSALENIKQKVALATDYDVSTAEHIQVVNYGLGGFYGPHKDPYTEGKEFLLDNRIATALFYLSDVELGGSTSFPLLKLNVKAEKGKLLVFKNLHSGGGINSFSKHCGCPVVLGNKWIATIWVRSKAQMFIEKCDLINDNNNSRKAELAEFKKYYTGIDEYKKHMGIL